MSPTIEPASTHALVEATRRMAPDFGALAQQTHLARDVPSSSIDALRRAGLFRVLQPRRWGGMQAGPDLFFDVQNAIAEHCASTAWVYGVLTVQSFILTQFGEQAQRDVWEEDGEALVCSSFPPRGTAVPVSGGYRLSGRWSFSSGSSHAQWALVGAREEGAPFPGIRIMLVPREHFAIDPVWDTFGLRGTGSNDIVIDNVFVPAHRTHVLPPSLTYDPADGDADEMPYRVPWYFFFAGAVGNLSIGIARGVLREFIQFASAKVAVVGGAALKHNQAMLAQVARLSAAIEAAEATFRTNFAMLMDRTGENRPVSLKDATHVRLQNSSVTRQLAAGVDELMQHVGATGINNGSPIVRGWLDIMAARVHPGNDPLPAEQALGDMLVSQA